MTGSMQTLMAASGGRLTGSASSILNTSPSTGIRGGSFTLANDGTFTSTGAAAGSWFTPTTTAIGTSWWAKATINSQSGTTFSGTTGSWTQLTTGEGWSVQNATATSEGTGNMTIAFSPDGGTTTAGSMNVTWDVGFAP